MGFDCLCQYPGAVIDWGDDRGQRGAGQCSMENMFWIKMSHVSVVREALQLCLSPVSHSVVPICLLIVLSVCLHFLSPSHTTRPVSTGVVSV